MLKLHRLSYKLRAVKNRVENKAIMLAYMYLAVSSLLGRRPYGVAYFWIYYVFIPQVRVHASPQPFILLR